MPRNGSGSYALPAGNPVVTGTVISSTVQNNTTSDIATALTQSLAYNGETTPVANLPMGTYRHTGVGNAVARTDYAALGQTQDGLINWVAATGTADALTATYSPTIAALVDSQLCFVRATAANATTTPTFSPNSLTARTITKLGGVAVKAAEWANLQELILRYNLANTRWELLNPTLLPGSSTQDFSVKILTAAGLLDISGASAGQIKFPAAQNASSDVNTLDDYEEGTWTPVLGATVSQTGQSYTTQTGRYTKIGNFVLATFRINLSTPGTVSGNAQLKGLPFTSFNDSGQLPGVHIGYMDQLGVAVVSLRAYVDQNATTATFNYRTAAATGETPAGGGLWQSGTPVMFGSVSYFTPT